MLLKISNLILLILIIFGSFSDIDCSDFENLSYGREVLSGAVPPYSPPKTTPPPDIEMTTQKSGFFSGIKNFFSRSSTELPIPEVTTTTTTTTTSTTTTTTTPKPTTPVPTIPTKPPTIQIGPTHNDYDHTNLRPAGMNPFHHDPISGPIQSYPSQPPPQSNRRDYINPNVKPGVTPFHHDPYMDHHHQGHSSITQPTQSPPPQSNQRRDYVNPNLKLGGSGNSIRPDPFSGHIQSTSSQHLPNSNHRDYNMNSNNGGSSSTIPVHSPIINPGLPSYGTPSPTTPTFVVPNNRRDYVAPIRPTLPIQGSGSSSTSMNIIPTQPSSTGSRRDFLNPSIPTAHSPIQPYYPVPNPTPYRPSAQSSGGGRRDYVNPNIGGHSPTTTNDFHGSPAPRKPIIEDFPALPPPKYHPPQHPTPAAPRNPNSAWTGGHTGGVTDPHPSGVSFVPHQGGGGGGGNRQLATDAEIASLTEILLSKDVNNQNSHITLNLQGKTRSTDRTDEAPNRLMEVDEVALQSPTIAKMRLLFNNYELDTMVNEYVTPNERKEENDFLDAIMSTTVMRHAMQFLQNKGLVTPDPKTHRDLVKTIWFTLYSRGQGRIGSSAFEHVFLTELKNNSVIGLHNWVYYNEVEKNGHIDYKGYIKKVDLGSKGTILKYRFDLDGIQKPVNSIFVGTSPELEIALYTVCFELRPDKDCPILLNGNRVNIITHTWRYRGKSLIGSAFPEI